MPNARDDRSDVARSRCRPVPALRIDDASELRCARRYRAPRQSDRSTTHEPPAGRWPHAAHAVDALRSAASVSAFDAGDGRGVRGRRFSSALILPKNGVSRKAGEFGRKLLTDFSTATPRLWGLSGPSAGSPLWKSLRPRLPQPAEFVRRFLRRERVSCLHNVQNLCYTLSVLCDCGPAVLTGMDSRRPRNPKFGSLHPGDLLGRPRRRTATRDTWEKVAD